MSTCLIVLPLTVTFEISFDQVEFCFLIRLVCVRFVADSCVLHYLQLANFTLAEFFDVIFFLFGTALLISLTLKIIWFGIGLVCLVWHLLC